jgi:hypothetical protein
MRSLALLFTLVSLAAFAQVRVTDVGSYPGKPGNSLGAFFNHKNPASLTVFVQRMIYSSADSGRTWAPSQMPEMPAGVQPQVTADVQNNLYYYYASPENGNQIRFSRSADAGKKWSDPISIPGSEGRNSFISLSAQPKKDGLVFLWTKSEEVEGTQCATHVYAAVSGSGGKKWKGPVKINKEPGDCSMKASMVRAAPPMIYKDGKVFVVWSVNENLYIDRSYDGGDLWINTDLLIGEQPGGWNIVVPGIPGASGTMTSAIDNSEFRTSGTIYLAYADQKNGATDTDIWLLRSPNQGDNWTYPIRVNLDEPGKYQYSPQVKVDAATGFLYIVYFDRRNYDDGQADIYLAWSGDTGGKFQEVKINPSPISAEAAGTALVNVTAHKGLIAVVWAVAEGDQTVVRAGVASQITLK